MLKDYLLQNWPLILVLLAFTISLISTVFMEKKIIKRMHILNGFIFLLSIVVFVEFEIAKNPDYRILRSVLAAVRYSATPFILAQVIFTQVKKMQWFIFIPATVLAILDFVSIPTGIVFSVTEANALERTPVIGYLPYVVVGLYSVFLIYLLVKRSNKHLVEIVPIAFMALALGSGLVLPFIFGADYSSIFCITIAIALFAYYEFTILQLTKKDSLTGLLNRQAFYADINNSPEDITALVSIDMNGLKYLNDNFGHDAGDEGLSTLALCFTRALKRRQVGYRVGGDEFVIVCRRNSEEDVTSLVERIKKYVSNTKYSCSIGYSVRKEETKHINELLKESDTVMYEEKQRYYQETGKERRRV